MALLTSVLFFIFKYINEQLLIKSCSNVYRYERYYDVINKIIKDKENNLKTKPIINWRLILFIIVIVLAIFYFKPFKVEYIIEEVRIQRTNWDNISVKTIYSKKTIFGEEKVKPDKENIVIKDNLNIIIYEGYQLNNIVIPDKDLASEENIEIKVTAFFDEKTISKTISVVSSFKKFTMRKSIDYPTDNCCSGEFKFSFDVKRQLFNSTDEYEIIYTNKTLPLNIKIYAEENENTFLTITSNNSIGTFDFLDYSNGNSLKNIIKNKLENEENIIINFEVTAEYHEKKVSYYPIEKTIISKSKENILKNADYFASEACFKIMEKICPQTGNSYSATIDEDKIEYDICSMRYTIPMTASWWGKTTIFSRQEHNMYIRGILYINDDGSDSEFEKTYTSEYAQKAINTDAILNGTVLILGELNRQGVFD